ncbi:putative WD40-repeat-containing domain superfamily, regulator of MON1-CCZ1 complex [Helianthus debilis subsp. tardiflorus]
MFGSTSSSQPGFGGSGALSHAYIQYPPLKCRSDGSRCLFYDDGNKLLISPTTDQVVSWKISPFSSDVAPTTDTISEGPILSVRYSLDSKLIAVQRSNHEVQFWVRETGETFSQKSKSESDSILGFFWTDCAVCDIVFVKTSGLDLYTYMPELKSLDLVETKKMNVSWYIYTHESRLVLLASGMQCKSFTGYQLSAAGVIRLPRFEMAMAKLDANSKPVLAAEDVHIVTVYGRIYCLQVDRVAMLLHSYRFYRDAVIQQGSLPIYSSKIAVSVVDNVLLIHQVDAKVILLYDIFADSRTPVSAPLPLLIRGSPSRTNAQSSDTILTNNATANLYGDDWIFSRP